MENSIREHMKPGYTIDVLMEVNAALGRILPEEFPENPAQYMEQLEESIGEHMNPGTTLENFYDLREILKPLPAERNPELAQRLEREMEIYMIKEFDYRIPKKSIELEPSFGLAMKAYR